MITEDRMDRMGMPSRAKVLLFEAYVNRGVMLGNWRPRLMTTGEIVQDSINLMEGRAWHLDILFDIEDTGIEGMWR